jgi:arylsulfatase A-like enzyme
LQNDEGDEVTRRGFLDRLGAGAVLTATGVGNKRIPGAKAHASSTHPKNTKPPAPWTPPPVIKNPNILVILCDQLRLPTWLTNLGSGQSLAVNTPNITALQNASYNFGEYFVAATMCTPSRSTLLTGLYTPQTAVYVNQDNPMSPPLNTSFPTWGEAIPTLNPAYKGSMWWFGKWHLSQNLNSTPLINYGFNTRLYPGGPTAPYNYSPDGFANEGSDGGTAPNGEVWASDAMIAGDFIGWLQGQQVPGGPPATAPGTPWCATVSLVNPHDIASAPAWMVPPTPPPGVPNSGIYFTPPAGAASPTPPFYQALPSPWNFESMPVPNKPALQYAYMQGLNYDFGSMPTTASAPWLLFLNQYFYLQNLVDQQIGRVITALNNSSYASNTIIVFASDHGEFGGSHGLHDKGFAVYDEVLRVPFSIQFPCQTSSIAMNQMFSSVDFFGLMCDLATGGSGQWRLLYPDLANRQSIWSFLYGNTSETRIAPTLGPAGLPYILHTFDASTIASAPQGHITCLRTKNDPTNAVVGAKYAIYTQWTPCTIYPNALTPAYEFYDYNPATTNNTGETGNDYYSQNQTTQTTITQYKAALGNWGPPSTGIIGSELNAPLVGKDANGNPLTAAQSTAQQLYFAFFANATGGGTCSG